MIISSWNVNSIRARIENITDYLKKFSPDIIMMQEIKTENQNFPYDDFKKLNYDCHVFGQKATMVLLFCLKKRLKMSKMI